MPSPRPRPIIFSGPMVRAITRETDPKTHTRRPVTGMALTWLDQFLPEFVADQANHLSPYGHAGDQLWVRETFAGDNLCGWVYRAEHPDADIAAGELDDGEQSLRRWTPSIHMPREASRLKLDVIAVRIERLLAISVDDCFAEGIEFMRCPQCHLACYGLPGWGHDDLQKTPPEAYWHLWDKLNERRGYGRAKNPWVWVIEFRRVNG
jgi:hypothetical protein